MPSMELKDKLQRTMRKVDTLRKRYLALLAEKKEMARQIERQELEIAKWKRNWPRCASTTSSCVWHTLCLIILKRWDNSRNRLPRWCGTLTGASNN